MTLADGTEVVYKVADYYAPASERSIRWDDPRVGIDWGITGTPQLSGKDAAGKALADAEVF